MLCVTITVVVDFLYILNMCLLSVFVIVKSRKFMLLLSSVSKVKFNFWCSLLMYWCSCLICLLFSFYRSNTRMSSTYLHQYIILLAYLLSCSLGMWVCSIYGMNISASMLKLGEPFRLCLVFLLKIKWFLLGDYGCDVNDVINM
jgi:hypothetical protein